MALTNAHLSLFIAFIILSPLPLGGNNLLAWNIFALITGILVLWFSVQKAAQGHSLAVPFSWIRIPAILFLAVCSWIFIQSLNSTPAAWHHPLWNTTSKALGAPLTGAISANPFETRTALMRLLTYGSIFWLALQMGRERRHAKAIILSIGVAVALYALYGLILWSLGSKTILWYDKWAYKNVLTSVFVNRNSFATYAGLGCLVFLSLGLRSFRNISYEHRGDQVSDRLTRNLSAITGLTGFYLLGLFGVFGALLLTGSRAGMAATLIAMAALLSLRAVKVRTGLLKIGLFAITAIAFLTILLGISGDKVAHRLETGLVQNAEEGRFPVYQRVIGAIADFPLPGSGYGTFRDVFPMYRNESTGLYGIWDKAHNTYLELMMELGLPAALALMMIVIWALWRCLIGLFKRHRSSHYPEIGLAATLLVAIHSLVDFSLQISGVTISYMALLGVGVAQSWSSRRR